MAFEEGHSKKGGRLKGTPNKTTKELRAILKEIVSQEIENLSTILEQVQGKERFELVVKLLPFILPKVENVNYKEGDKFTLDWN